jgi:hypothetical protein
MSAYCALKDPVNAPSVPFPIRTLLPEVRSCPPACERTPVALPLIVDRATRTNADAP